jgi:hypothetical protein
MTTITKLSDAYSFTAENIKVSPNEKGVYALYEDGQLIYYGRAQGGSVTIRSRLQSHFLGNEGACTKRANTYARRVVDDPVEAEKFLLREYLDLYGTLPRCNDRIG